MPGEHKTEFGVRRSGGSSDLRQGNLAQILRYLRDHGPSSRHDIARGCGLGISTMTDLVGDLASRRLVSELGPVRRAGAGRPTRPIALDGDPWCVLGLHVDVDRIHVVAATVGGRELWQETAWHDLRDSGNEAGTKVVRELVADQLARVPEGSSLVAVEIGVPGQVARDQNVVLLSPALGWRDLALGDQIGRALVATGVPAVSVRVTHDCHLAGLHAARTQVPPPQNRLVAYLGGVRDVGSALIVDGEIFRGVGGGAGDLEHLHVDTDGPGCWCGRQGCLNAFVQLRTLLASSGLVAADEIEQTVADQPLKSVTLLAEAAQEGRPAVLEVLEQAGTRLGRAIDDIIGVVNPHAVVLGGYLGRLGPYLLPAVERELAIRRQEASYAETSVVALDEGTPQVTAGAVLAARDACLYDPVALTSAVA